MKSLALAVVLLVCVAQLGYAHPQDKGSEPTKFEYNGSGYATFGIGECRHGVAALNGNGGGDKFLSFSNVSLGAEIGAYQFVERNGSIFGITTLNVGYHFVNRVGSDKLDPFVSLGPGVVFFSDGGGGVMSYGGGLNYWYKPKIAVRSEGRFYTGENLMMFRIGFSFR